MINLVHERTPMPEQSKDLRCKNFDEVALGYTPLEAVGEAMRCLNCREKPCVAGCPIHQQIPEFLARVAEGDFDGAYDVITQRSSLPAVCGRVCPQEQQCEKNCAHVRKGEAVAIGRLERFVADWHDAHTPISVPEVEKKGKKVAVIGSGPAGIACAGDLAALGYEVTVFEKLAYAGGILTYGIPTFVLPRSVVDRAPENPLGPGGGDRHRRPSGWRPDGGRPLCRRVPGRLRGQRGGCAPGPPRTGHHPGRGVDGQRLPHPGEPPQRGTAGEHPRCQAGPGGGRRQRGGGRRPLCPPPGGGDHHGLPPHHR